jgi:predicted nucleotidyltransferase
MRMDIETIKCAVAPDCRDFAVKRLDVFGSVARGEDSAGSDLDLLVEFKDPADHPAKRFFGLLHRLEDLFHCKIDLLTPSGLRNPYIQRRIFAERVPVYEG